MKPISQELKCVQLNTKGDASPLLGHEGDAVTEPDMGKKNNARFVALSSVFLQWSYLLILSKGMVRKSEVLLGS